MKKKHQNILLLLAVFFLWGLIVVKLYRNIAGNETNSSDTSSAKASKKNIIEESYEMHTYTRDPFLSIIKDTAENRLPDTIVKRTFISSSSVPVLPAYFGYLLNDHFKTAILKFENKTIFLQENGKYKDIQLVSITSDSVVLKIANGRFCVRINSRKRNNSVK